MNIIVTGKAQSYAYVGAIVYFLHSCSTLNAFTLHPPKSCAPLVYNKYPIPYQLTKISTSTMLQMGLSNDDSVEGSNRVFSCLPYLIPLLDGDHFGYFIYQQIPPLYFISHVLLMPIENIYHALPFSSIIAFVVLLAVTQNSKIDSSVRFNAQQALLIDVSLIFPELLGSTVPKNVFPRFIVESSTNFIFYTLIACLTYSVVSNIAGRKPNQIPIISEAAQSAIGPL